MKICFGNKGIVVKPWLKILVLAYASSIALGRSFQLYTSAFLALKQKESIFHMVVVRINERMSVKHLS